MPFCRGGDESFVDRNSFAHLPIDGASFCYIPHGGAWKEKEWQDLEPE
jgi:hypothetical protein